MAKTASSPPQRTGGGIDVPRSDTSGDALGHQLTPDVTGVSAATASQKRGRGLPPKPKSDSHENGALSAQPSVRRRGRPRRDGTPAAASTASVAPVVRSGHGRPKRLNTLHVTASLVATVDGSRKRGRTKKDDVSAATITASTLAPAKKRGRKPKTGEVGRRSVGSPRKQDKVKEAGEKLKETVSAIKEKPIEAIVDVLYGKSYGEVRDPVFFKKITILSPTNEDIDVINNYMMSKLSGEEREYLSSDSIDTSDTSTTDDEQGKPQRKTMNVVYTEVFADFEPKSNL